MNEICKRCRRVCFSLEQVLNHDCFDMDDKLDAEIALASWNGKLPELDAMELEIRRQQQEAGAEWTEPRQEED